MMIILRWISGIIDSEIIGGFGDNKRCCEVLSKNFLIHPFLVWEWFGVFL
jgi:hypothetical protein